MRGPARWATRRLALRCAVSTSGAGDRPPSPGRRVRAGLERHRHSARVGAVEPWPTSGPTVLFLGRHEPRKGLAVLVDAVVQHGVDARIWVAVRGLRPPPLKEATLGDARFEWLGTVGEEEKLRRLRGADVLAAPSLHGESFGIVLLEGMAARTTVVASNIPGYANVARPSRDALLVPPGDAAALAAACARRSPEGR